jgi:hypothetical protein
MQSKAATVEAYLAELTPDRRDALNALRQVIRKNLSKGLEEGMQYGMIGYYVPHGVYPPGYHCDPKQPLPYGGMASQKNHMSLYLMCIYADPKLHDWFKKEWAKTGKKLDMGKACIRFKKLDDLPLDLIGETVRKIDTQSFIDFYESTIKTMGKRTGAKPSKKATTKKSATKKSDKKSAKESAAKKKTPKKAAAKKKSAGKQAAKKAAARR